LLKITVIYSKEQHILFVIDII